LPRECRVFSAINPGAQWGWSEIFANDSNYLLKLIVWQNATPQNKAALARHKNDKPKPFIPEFIQPKQQSADISKNANKMSVDDVKSWLSVPRGL
jgi:hypothetical protein